MTLDEIRAAGRRWLVRDNRTLAWYLPTAQPVRAPNPSRPDIAALLKDHQWQMLDNIDLVLLDVKSGDEQTYKRVTGRSLAPTIAFGDRLAARGIETWVRFVLVPGLTDDPANVETITL